MDNYKNNEWYKVVRILFIVLTFILVVSAVTSANGADTNTVSSTVVTNNTPPTANAPSDYKCLILDSS